MLCAVAGAGGKGGDVAAYEAALRKVLAEKGSVSMAQLGSMVGPLSPDYLTITPSARILLMHEVTKSPGGPCWLQRVT